MSQIAIIGYGNLGFHFARTLAKDHEVSIFSRSERQNETIPLSEFNASAFDIILLTIPDDSIKAFADNMQKTDAIVLHASGVRPLSDLSKHDKVGVFYPLQTFTKAKTIDFSSISIFLEANENADSILDDFAKSFCNRISWLNSEKRSRLHLAAVFACNFINHMFRISDEILKEAGMNFGELAPLVNETVEKAFAMGPSNSQTGPAVRNDQETMASHQNLLTEPQTKELYELISRHIQLLKS